MQIADNWFEVEEIDDQTFAIKEPGHWEKFNAYLLLSETEACLIDTGMGIGNIKKVCQQLTSNEVKVLTTHTHWDHIGGHQQFEELYVHEAEVDWLVNGVPAVVHQAIDSLKMDYFTKPPPKDFSLENYQIFRGQPTGLLRDQDVIQVGKRRLEVLHTPGHSPGHICLFEKDRGYLFSGDLLYKGTLYAFFETTDPILLANSVAKIAAVEGIERIFPSHNEIGFGPEFIQRVKNAFEHLKQHKQLKHGTGVHTFEDFSIRL